MSDEEDDYAVIDDDMAALLANVPHLQLTTGDMLVDDYDQTDEKQEVAEISPDDSLNEAEAEPLADDCKFSGQVYGTGSWSNSLRLFSANSRGHQGEDTSRTARTRNRE